MGGYALATHIVIQMPARRPLPSGMNQDFNLPPCRLCGKRVATILIPGKSLGSFVATIGCNGCGKYGSVVDACSNDSQEAKRLAIEKWNSRATESPNG